MADVKMTVVPATVYATNTVIVESAGHAVLVDPGAGTANRVGEYLRTQGTVLRAIVLTHGHVDHTWDAAVIAEEWDVPVVIGAADVYRLEDPFGMRGIHSGSHNTMGPLAGALEELGMDPAAFVTPHEVYPVESAAADALFAELNTVMDISWSTIAAPGHTQGSTFFVVNSSSSSDTGNEPPENTPSMVIFSGDVLFQGNIGRTDLPGGDMSVMLQTLERLSLELPRSAMIVPGHGPATSVAAELATNPYLSKRV